MEVVKISMYKQKVDTPEIKFPTSVRIHGTSNGAMVRQGIGTETQRPDYVAQC